MGSSTYIKIDDTTWKSCSNVYYKVDSSTWKARTVPYRKVDETTWKETMQYNLWDNLQNYWRLENANDSKGSYNLTPSTTISYVAGINNNCADLSTNKYYTVTADGITDFAKQTFSVGGWAKRYTNSGDLCLWSYDYTSTSAPYYAQHIRYNGGSATIAYFWNKAGTVKGITSSAITSLTNWNHIMCTMSPTAAKVYINGVLAGTNTTDVGNITYYNQEVWIGRSNFGMYLNSTIDEWGFWTRELSLKDVERLYAAGSGVFY